MDAHTIKGFADELTKVSHVKVALIERLIRLGFTDVPGTPRMLMRKRSPQELAGIQHGVEKFFNRYEQPAIAKATGLIDKHVKHPTANKVLKKGTELVVKNPELALTELSPVPGTGAMWLGAKKGIERAIDKVAPIPSA
jgi:hypothetical protein